MGKYIVELNDINKSFGGIKALDQVSFNLKSGEVLALLGENGAGKSTLMKILSGVYTRDSGSMKIFDKEYNDLTPTRAQELGISIIHQELNLCEHLSIAQNIFLGREYTNNIVLSDRKMNEEAREILSKLNLDIDPNTLVGDLSVSKQQMVEIAKALSTDAKILIMDEPTSALTATEIEELFKIINHLKDEGIGIVYISHRLEELKHIVDRVMILRDGQYVTSLDFEKTNLDEIISYMVGREITEKFPRVDCDLGEVILEVKGLSSGDAVKDVSFNVRKGEILGIAGLMGAGRTETTRAIFGADPIDKGEIILKGRELDIKSPSDAIENGILLVPEDRRKDGLCTKLSIADNISLPNLSSLAKSLGVVPVKEEASLIDKIVGGLGIKIGSLQDDVDRLSGGNQQKVVVGKWLDKKANVIIFDEPTRGVDVASKVEIYNIMNDLKEQGIGVVFVSSEMPEILGISDKIIVMADGRVTKEFDRDEASQENILKYATKFEDKFAKANTEVEG